MMASEGQGASSSSESPLEHIVSMFAGKLPIKQVMAVFRASGDEANTTAECLLSGPSLDAILTMTAQRY